MKLLLLLIILTSVISTVFSQEENIEESMDRIIIEEQRFESKLKKPQLTLISGSRRPLFLPMALTRRENGKSIDEMVSFVIFENKVFVDAFYIKTR